jgi:Flp pilus assembly protein TadG
MAQYVAPAGGARNTASTTFGRVCAVVRRFGSDESGSYLVISGLLMPMLVGIVGLGTEAGLWYSRHHKIQSAADSAAVTAATDYYLNHKADALAVQAQSIAATYGFVAGTNGVSLTVNQPPKSGTYTGDVRAVEVLIREPQRRLFSALFLSSDVSISARSVAIGIGGKGCVIALDPAASGAATVQGTANVQLDGCSLYDNSASSTSMTIGGSGTISAESVNTVGGIASTAGITTTEGIATGQQPIADPYADATFGTFSGCDKTNFVAKTTVTINPGVYCGGLSLNAGAVVTLNAGIYYLDQGSLSVNGGATLNGTGVTLVFTSSNGHNYASASINGGANINLVAPTTGPTAGIVLFGDRNMTAGTAFKLNGGSTELFGGAIYVPRGDVTFSGGAASTNGCLQLIAATVTFVGNANFAINCRGYGTKSIGSALAKLTE